MVYFYGIGLQKTKDINFAVNDIIYVYTSVTYIEHIYYILLILLKQI